MNDRLLDQRVRTAAFRHLDELGAIHGPELPYAALKAGFPFEGTRVHLMGPQGIFKPAILPEVPLSITTAPPSPRKPAPYADGLVDGNLIAYCYRGTDPRHRENVGLKRAMRDRVPLVYFFGVTPGWYLAEYPAFVVGDDEANLRFTIDLESERGLVGQGAGAPDQVGDARRAYLTVPVQQRLHQRSFRRRVLEAYREHCAVCRLRHAELLDAAHIIPDSQPRGEPVVPNGLSLCKLHHAAFDGHFLGIRPDLKIEIREDLLREKDGPMLVHGLQGFQGRDLRVPRSSHLRPDADRLEERYEEFRKAV